MTKPRKAKGRGPDASADAPTSEPGRAEPEAGADAADADASAEPEVGAGAADAGEADDAEPAAPRDVAGEGAEGERAARRDPEAPARGPAFAKDFPGDPALQALVAAFGRGDFRAVRERGPKLARDADDDAVRRAALLLVERTSPDPKAKIFFALAAALLVFLTAFWIAESRRPHAPAERRPVEYVK